MDPKIEMNHLRVLHDYLNQTLDVLARGPRLANGYTPGFGYSPFAGSIPSATASLGTDIVYGQGLFGFAGAPVFNGVSHAPVSGINPFTGMPAIGAAYSPFAYAQSWGQAPWTAAQTPWTAGQTPWTSSASSWPAAEVARQAQFNQALAAKQSVLEAMCRVAGIPV